MTKAISWIRNCQPLSPRLARPLMASLQTLVGRRQSAVGSSTKTEGGSASVRLLPTTDCRLPTSLGGEQDDDGDNEGVDGDRLGEGGADDHRRPDRAFGLGVAPERLERAAHSDADPETRADRADPDRDRGA